MKRIYLVERTDDVDYDEYTGFVCVADDEEEAIAICDYEHGRDSIYSEWPLKTRTVKITLVGVAVDGLESSIIFESFLAG